MTEQITAEKHGSSSSSKLATTVYLSQANKPVKCIRNTQVMPNLASAQVGTNLVNAIFVKIHFVI